MIGDSVIDNNNYIQTKQLSLTDHLIKMLPEWEVIKLASDGALISDIINFQTTHVVKNTPIVLSAGGNDLLRLIEVINDTRKLTLNQSIRSLKSHIEEFREKYKFLLNLLEGRVLCLSIYNPAFSMHDRYGFLSQFQNTCEIILMIFNDVIRRQVSNRTFDFLELRDLMTEKKDYANTIEPSHFGGKKIADGISNWIKLLGKKETL